MPHSTPSPPPQAELERIERNPAAEAGRVAELRAQAQQLRKYVTLNYVAVVKAVKKRNRHLRGAAAAARDSGSAVSASGGGASGLRAVDVLSRQGFFTSPALAAIAVRAELLARVSGHAG